MLSLARRGSQAAAVGAMAASVVMCAVWAGVASAGKNAGRSASTGTLEICKAADNGAKGTTFFFDVRPEPLGMAAGAPVSVVGGSCTSLSQRPNAQGIVKIAEELGNPGGWTVASITGTDLAGDDVTGGSANLKRGSVSVSLADLGDDTVTYTNQQASSSLKICKWSSSTALQNRQYSFTVGQQTVTAVAGSSPGTGTCSALIPEQVGSKVKITEAVPPGESVAGITVDPDSILVSQNGAMATVKVAAGLNVVTYEDEPLGPPKLGFIEVCKDAYDSSVRGSFHFELTDTRGNYLDVHADKSTGEDVLAGQCSAPIQVPAGTVVVTESENDGTELQSVWASPANDLGLVNLTNQTANVVVPVASGAAGEVQVHFVNETLTATLKLCTFLTGGSDLAGQTFTYTVADDQILDGNGNPVEFHLSIVASAGANGACKVVSDQRGRAVLFPIGSDVTAVEDLSGYPFVSGDGGYPGSDDTQTTTIVGGINSIFFVDQGSVGLGF